MSQRLPVIDIIIVNWKTRDRLRECLSSLSHTQRGGFVFGRVVVVDNASTDDSADGLDYPALPLRIFRNSVNRGFAAGCNQGASDSSADYLLCLNPDTRLLRDTLEKSVVCMSLPERSRTGILGVQLLDEKGKIARTCARFLTTGGFVSKMLGLSRLFPTALPENFYLEWNHLESREIEHVMGAYFFVRNSLFKDIGGFDERFFVYLEDADLSLRVRQAGWSSYYLASAQCYHSGCGSSDQVRALRLFYVLRSRIFYGFKNFSLANAVTLLLATLFIEPIPRVVHAILRGSITQTGEVTRGYFLLWQALPRILGSPYLRRTQAVRLDGGAIQPHG